MSKISNPTAHRQNPVSRRTLMPHRACSLLTGRSDCNIECESPLSEAERRRRRIHRNGDATTIARVTVRPRQKFWRWRDLPFPRTNRVPSSSTIMITSRSSDDGAAAAAAIFCAVFLACSPVHLPPRNLKSAAFATPTIAVGFLSRRESGSGLQNGAGRCFSHACVAIARLSKRARGGCATLLFLFSFSGALEHYALGRRTQRKSAPVPSAMHPKRRPPLTPNGDDTKLP